MSGVNDEFGLVRAECRQFDLDLPAYLEGEERPGVASHARACPFCSVLLADLELIRSESSEVLLEDPPASVWANVRATLAGEGIFREPPVGWLSWLPRFGLMRYAAPFSAVACLTLIATILMLPPAPAPSGGPAATVNAGLEQTVKEMERSYHEHEKFLDPAVQASYREGLKSLDDSIRECSASVSKEPTNTLAREYLDTAYEQKVAVLSAALEYDGQ